MACHRSGRAAQYLRMSTDHQRYSLGNQAAAIAAYAQAEGLEIVRTYEDAGVSGVTTARRAGLKAMLQDVLSPDRPFDLILVLDVSRWGRYQDPDEAAHYEFLCREAGAEVRYCAEAFANDGSGPSTIMKHLKRVMAGEYSRELSERLQTAKRRQTLRGFAPGGPPPFGAQRQIFNADGQPGAILKAGERKPRLDQDVRWAPGPEQDLKTLRRIFREFTQGGYGITEIADRLNRCRVTYRDGTDWTYARVKAALTNEIAIGQFVFNKRPGLFKHPGRLLPAAEWKRVRVCQPIVPVAVFKAATRRLAAPASGRRSDQRMLDDLREVLADRGYLSNKVVREHPVCLGYRSYYDRFGSLSAAYKLIGYTASPSILRNDDGSPMTDADMIDRLKKLLRREGRLTTALVHNDLRTPSVKVLQKRFGSLLTAWKLAGYAPKGR